MSDIQKALSKSIVFVTGEEDLLRSRALKHLMEGVPILPDDFDLQVFDAQSSSPAEWVGAAGTAPFLADRRVVVVRHLLQAEPPKHLDKIPSPGSEGLVILVGDPVGGTDDRRAKAISVAKQWESLVTKSDGTVLKFNPDPEKTRLTLKAEAQSSGVAISEKALTTLVDITGGSFSRAMEEFEKLVLFVGPSETISDRHVSAIAVPSKDWNVFLLTDSIVDNNVGEALRQLRILVGNVSKAEDAAFSQILPQVSRYLRLVWQARVSIDLSESLKSPSPRYQSMLPKKPNLVAEAPYRQTKYLKMARQVSLKSLSKALGIVADTDARLKGSLASFSAIDTLETMVLELARIFANKR